MSNNALQSALVTLVAQFIRRHRLMDESHRYLVALSGGADSVALLRVLLALGYEVEAAHCNFHLRAEESDRDEAFCKQLCERLHVPFHVAHFETREFAEAHHLSIEMAARQLRYGYFRQLVSDIGAAGVVVAHHRDDSVETVLMNLIRGTGLHGLTGIDPEHDGVIRPLLCVGRQQIVDFLDTLRQDYVTDSSNLVDDVVRNKIRLNILPLMREVNPSVASSVAAMAERMREVAEVYDAEMGRRAQEARVSTDHHDAVAYRLEGISSEGLLFHILHPMGFKPKIIEEVGRAVNDRNWGASFLSESSEVLVDRDLLFIVPRKSPFRPMRLPVCGRYVVGERQALTVEEQVVGDGFHISRSNDCVTLDAAKVCFPLVLRTVRPGDRFAPLGMRGSKLVSDFLTDLKVGVLDRRRQMVVADAENRIVWVVGRRPAHPCRITDSSVKAIVMKWERG